MNFFKFISLFLATIILTMAISTSVAAFQNIGGQFEHGTNFSGAFEFNPTTECPVSRRTLDQLFFDFAISPTEFNNGQILPIEESLSSHDSKISLRLEYVF